MRCTGKLLLLCFLVVAGIGRAQYTAQPQSANAVKQLAVAFEQAVTARDRQAVHALFDWTGVDALMAARQQALIDRLLTSEITEIQMFARQPAPAGNTVLDGIVYRPSLAVKGYLQVTLSGAGQPAETLDLAYGRREGRWIFTNLVPLKALQPKGLIEVVVYSVRSRVEFSGELVYYCDGQACRRSFTGDSYLHLSVPGNQVVSCVVRRADNPSDAGLRMALSVDDQPLFFSPLHTAATPLSYVAATD